MEAECGTQAEAAGAILRDKTTSDQGKRVEARHLQFIGNAGWGLRVLFIEGTNGERIEAAEINDWCKRSPPDE